MSEMGAADYVSERKHVKNFLIVKNWRTSFIRHGLRGLVVKTIEGTSTEANDLRCSARYVFPCRIYFICQKTSHGILLFSFSVIEDIVLIEVLK